MALQIWLPLNGDLTQQGLSNVTVTNNGATVDNNGKIGKCYSFDGTDDRISIDNKISLSYPISIAAWIYPTNVSSTNTQYILSYNTDTGGTAGHLLGLGFYGGSALAIWHGGSFVNTTTSLSNNTWYHVCATIDSSKKVNVYVNGSNIYTATISNIPASTWLTFGARCNSSTGGSGGASYYYKGKMNDVRVYDHALSAKEVKDLAKGLVLHYRLAGPGGANLLPGTHINENTITYPTSNYSDRNISSIKTDVLNGTTYTVSFEAKSTHNGDKIRIHFYNPSNITKGIGSQGQSNAASDGNMDFTLSDKWEKYWATYTIPANGNTSRNVIIARVGASGSGYPTGTGVLSFRHEKVEEGSIATPWVPHTSDSLYSILGYNNNIEYDCSGYHRNGAKSGTIAWDIDSPRYTTSYKFVTNTSKIKLPAFNMSGFANSYTFSWWQYNIGSGNMPWGFSDGNRLNPYHTSNLCWNTGDGGSNPFLPNIASSTLYNAWHHIAITGNGTDTKLYIDGEYKGKATTYKSLTGTQIYLSGWDTGTSYTMTGSREADFRIYSTTLSAEDISELYHSAVIVDNTGKNYAYEYFEA